MSAMPCEMQLRAARITIASLQRKLTAATKVPALDRLVDLARRGAPCAGNNCGDILCELAHAVLELEALQRPQPSEPDLDQLDLPIGA